MAKVRRKRVKGYTMTRKGKVIHVKSFLRKKRPKKIKGGVKWQRPE